VLRDDSDQQNRYVSVALCNQATHFVRLLQYVISFHLLVDEGMGAGAAGVISCLFFIFTPWMLKQKVIFNSLPTCKLSTPRRCASSCRSPRTQASCSLKGSAFMPTPDN